MRRIVSGIVVATVVVIAIGFTIWGTAALWFRAPCGGLLPGVLSASFALLGIGSVALWVKQKRAKLLLPMILVVGGLLAWWSGLQPPTDVTWSPDVARQVTGQIDGDILKLDGVRNFEWRPDESYVENWETQTYDLKTLVTTDLFLSYWAGPEMAHFILSFGFSDGRYLAWSIEVRRQAGGAFSPVADVFKANPIVILAATERDVVGLRTNIRQEDVHLYRLSPDPETARNLLVEYVRDANALAVTPRWYNSLTTNCTTVVFKMMRAIGDGLPLDWRVIVNGYLPEYGYERGALNTTFSIEDLRELGRVSSKGQAFGLRPGYSEAIRQGVPGW